MGGRTKSEAWRTPIPGLRLASEIRCPNAPISRMAWSSGGAALAVCHPQQGAFSVIDVGTLEQRTFPLFPPRHVSITELSLEEISPYEIAWAHSQASVAVAGMDGAWLVNLTSGEKRNIFGADTPDMTRRGYPGLRFRGDDDRPIATFGSSLFGDNAVIDLGSERKSCLTDDGAGNVHLATYAGIHILKGNLARGLPMPWFNRSLETCIALAASARRNVVAFGERSTIHIVDMGEKRVVAELEAHAGTVESLSFSGDGRLLISRGLDKRYVIWSCDTWRKLGAIEYVPNPRWICGMAFHPKEGILATLHDGDTTIRLWDVDSEVAFAASVRSRQARYANAKVVLVGNTGVGKSGLGLVLSGKKFMATSSTHGRRVWSMEALRLHKGTASEIVRETLLWDLAGQPGYRLIHQLHLHEVAVALVLFDSRSEVDPFSGVAYWARALDEATRGFPLVKFLVAARSDRGTPPVSAPRINGVLKQFGFQDYVETSAKEGRGIRELRKKVMTAIRWDLLPFVATDRLIRRVKTFLLRHKRKGQVLDTAAALRDQFNKQYKQTVDEPTFHVSLGRLESTGLIRRLSFGDHVLLQPELLDDYCGWMAIAARSEPDGLGYVSEQRALAGNFVMDSDRFLPDRPEEKTLLLATVEELVHRNIAFREQGRGGPVIVFPSELNADLPAFPGGYSFAVAFTFAGPISAIYATLAVRLIHSESFEKRALYKNASLFHGPKKQMCGFSIEFPDRENDSLGRLLVFFAAGVETTLKLIFLRFVEVQLHKLAFADSVRRERIYHCAKCNYTVPADAVALRIRQKETTIICPGCGKHYPIDDLREGSASTDREVQRIEATAANEQERQARLTVLPEREKTNQYHVFLCHNSKDKDEIRRVAAKLRDEGVLAWFDEQSMLAGDRYPRTLENAIDRAPVIAVFLGPHDLGPWQDIEYQAALQRSLDSRESYVRLIPVLLPGAKEREMPVFLRAVHRIDLRDKGADNRSEMRNLVDAIFDQSELSIPF
jgi:GTPase SAR1 family protein